MKINDYKLEIRNEDTGELYVFRNGEKIFVQDIDIKNKNSSEVDELVKNVISYHNYEVVDVSQTIIERDDLTDRKADLSMVRTSMRKILKDFGNRNMSLAEKKEMIDVYEVMCKAADVITKSCVVELAYDKFASDIK